MIITLVLGVLRTYVAMVTAYGDAEALYASYAIFPQPAYLDHPGLIGLIARVIGQGSAPDPRDAHLVTTALATLLPWIGFAAARAAGASVVGGCFTLLVLALVPELAIGLYALSPDLPLALLWLGALGLAALATRATPKSFRALWTTLAVGAVVGLASLAKASGVLLGMALLVHSLTASQRARWRTVGPWAAVAVAVVLVAPVVVWEAREGYPMLHHRFVSQADPTRALINLGVVLAGQLAYVTPPFLVGAWLVWRDLWRSRREDPVSAMLAWATVVPALPLLLLCMWSAKAEPHWVAPAFLPLAVHVGRSGSLIGRKLARSSLITGAAVTLLAFTWVVTPLPVWLLGRYATHDVSQDLYAWGPGRDLLLEAVQRSVLETHRMPVVVGPHWVVCAQAQALVARKIPVGCNSPRQDDFDRWLPRRQWLNAPVVLYVQDDRFPVAAANELPDRYVSAISRTNVQRGGRVVRSIRITRLEKSRETAGINRAPEPARAAPPP